ncbi:MAG TPA: N-acetyl-gamma-glutamyl-phosphate reductase [Verrucomicrobia bacterium]|nr:N-acetyl-gamma-glutamyl-phosphate reductase [Verrucomicrobiota bacterium]
MTSRIFIDGSAGTTGLRIRERLGARPDVELIALPEELRKDPGARRDALNAADVAFLCLPDAAAVEAAGLVSNPHTVIIDTSTAHRTADGWTYGFAELAGQRAKIAQSRRIANPGCHASGFIALVAPLVRAGLLSPETPLVAFSLTGYSGGGKKMIADYGQAATPLHQGGRLYALGQTHKHLPEMMKMCGLSAPPVFSPVVVPCFSGMEVVVPLAARQVEGGFAAAKACLAESYAGASLVNYRENASEEGFLSSAAYSGRDDMEVSVWGCAERFTLVARFDNLGKGASGAAIQNMNLVLGRPETAGLALA